MTKMQTYGEIIPQAEALINGVSNRMGALANVAALLKEAFADYFWVGFYLVEDGALQLGPFQGPVACYTIQRGRGVCGTAWAEARSIVVDDVERFPGHIACSSRSRSEIVVPIVKQREVVGVIDVDSTALSAFDDVDRQGLERLAEVIARLF